MRAVSTTKPDATRIFQERMQPQGLRLKPSGCIGWAATELGAESGPNIAARAFVRWHLCSSSQRSTAVPSQSQCCLIAHSRTGSPKRLVSTMVIELTSLSAKWKFGIFSQFSGLFTRPNRRYVDLSALLVQLWRKCSIGRNPKSSCGISLLPASVNSVPIGCAFQTGMYGSRAAIAGDEPFTSVEILLVEVIPF